MMRERSLAAAAALVILQVRPTNEAVLEAPRALR
jgi:hypothetical protein